MRHFLHPSDILVLLCTIPDRYKGLGRWCQQRHRRLGHQSGGGVRREMLRGAVGFKYISTKMMMGTGGRDQARGVLGSPDSGQAHISVASLRRHPVLVEAGCGHAGKSLVSWSGDPEGAGEEMCTWRSRPTQFTEQEKNGSFGSAEA